MFLHVFYHKMMPVVISFHNWVGKLDDGGMFYDSAICKNMRFVPEKKFFSCKFKTRLFDNALLHKETSSIIGKSKICCLFQYFDNVMQ